MPICTCLSLAHQANACVASWYRGSQNASSVKPKKKWKTTQRDDASLLELDTQSADVIDSEHDSSTIDTTIMKTRVQYIWARRCLAVTCAECQTTITCIADGDQVCRHWSSSSRAQHPSPMDFQTGGRVLWTGMKPGLLHDIVNQLGNLLLSLPCIL